MPNFIYPRTITATRAATVKTAQDGLHQAEVPVIAAPGLDAAIQLKRARPVGPVAQGGPTQSADEIPEWLILFKGPRDLIQKGDKIIDDLGIAYQVEAPYWNSLGWNLTARLYHP